MVPIIWRNTCRLSVVAGVILSGRQEANLLLSDLPSNGTLSPVPAPTQGNSL